ncbi:MAG: ABC transporter substrate-binding protein [Actinomycetota bacterium]
MRHSSPAALAAVLVLVSSCAVAGRRAPEPSSDAQIRIAVKQPSSLDPAHLNDPAAILVARQVFETLVTFDPKTLALAPALADRWETLDNGSRFIFHLRPGVKFHNGRALLAEDVRFSLNRLAQRDTGSEVAYLLDQVAGYEAVNKAGTAAELEGIRTIGDDAVEFRLIAPWFEFPYVLTNPATTPVPQAEFLANPETFRRTPIGLGPYKVKAANPAGGDFVLGRFDGYRGKKPSIASIAFLVYDQASSAWRDFESGLIDIAEAPPGSIASAEAKYGKAGFSPVAAGIYIGFNVAKFPDIRIRRAVSLAINRPSIAHEIYDNVLVPATGLTPPGLHGAPSACGDYCRYDPGGAKALIAQVYPAGGVLPAGFDYQAGGPQDEFVKAIQTDLAEAGLSIVPQPADLPGLYRKLDEKGHDIFRLGWAADYPRADWFVAPMFRTGSQDNYTGFSRPDVDELIVKARSEPNPKTRLQLYQQLEKKNLEDLSMIPIGHFRNHYAASAKVKNFYVDRLGGFQVSRFEIEP